MNWLTNYVRPKIRALVQRSTVPENLWAKCPACDQMIFHRELAANLNVCTHCGHHLRLSAKARLDATFDGAVYETIALPEVPSDPLKFRDKRRYAERLKEARTKLGERDAL